MEFKAFRRSISANPQLRQEIKKPKKLDEMKLRRRSRSLGPDDRSINSEGYQFGQHTRERAERKAMLNMYESNTDQESIRSLGSFKARKMPNFQVDNKIIFLNDKQLTFTQPFEFKTDQRSLSRQESKKKRIEIENKSKPKMPGSTHATKEKHDRKKWSPRGMVQTLPEITIGKLKELAIERKEEVCQSPAETPKEQENTFDLS